MEVGYRKFKISILIASRNIFGEYYYTNIFFPILMYLELSMIFFFLPKFETLLMSGESLPRNDLVLGFLGSQSESLFPSKR